MRRFCELETFAQVAARVEWAPLIGGAHQNAVAFDHGATPIRQQRRLASTVNGHLHGIHLDDARERLGIACLHLNVGPGPTFTLWMRAIERVLVDRFR